MNKISALTVNHVLSEASQALKDLSTERDALRSENLDLHTKIANYEMKARAEKIASLMEQKGLEGGLNREEKINMLLTKAAQGQLPIIEQAIQFASTNNPFGKVGDRPATSDDSLIGYLMSE
jgi:hypothetical protein